MPIQITEKDRKIIEKTHKRLGVFYPSNLSNQEFDLWDRLLRMIRYMDEESIVEKRVVRLICQKFYDTPTNKKEVFLSQLYNLSVKKIEKYKLMTSIDDMQEVEDTLNKIKSQLNEEEQDAFIEEFNQISQEQNDLNSRVLRTSRPLSENEMRNLIG